jgi:transposase
MILTELAERTTVYLVTGYTDMRKGIDGLAAIVSGKLSLDPWDNSLFLFCGKNTRKLKGLLWEGDGFLLLNKRLDNGRYRWPRDEAEAYLLTPQQIRWLMEGLEIEQPKAIKPGQPCDLY